MTSYRPISIQKYLMQKDVRPTSVSFRLIGLTPAEFREHITATFTEGMSFQNYGSVWVVDHIIPLVSEKNMSNAQLQLWHYTNLRALTKQANAVKGRKIVEKQTV